MSELGSYERMTHRERREFILKMQHEPSRDVRIAALEATVAWYKEALEEIAANRGWYGIRAVNAANNALKGTTEKGEENANTVALC